MRTDIPVSHVFRNESDMDAELQAAYKESQARIATFEKVLRERTPLGNIDQVADFGNYLNNLSVRTEVGPIRCSN